MPYAVRLVSFILVLLPIISACQDDCRIQHPEWLYGRWKVFFVDRGGDKIGGRAFKGSEYTFLENGVARSESHYGDTNSVRYLVRCDTMTYLNPEGEEHYRIDTLSQDRLRISGELQGIPTTIHFMRVRMPGELPPKD